MNVNKLHALLMLVLAAFPVGAAPAAVSDPQSLLLEARAAFQRGDAESAESAISELRELLDADPYWDPDRSFAENLVPETEARIEHLKKALEQLNAIAPPSGTAPGSAPAFGDPEDISPYFDWANTGIEAIRTELERIIETVPVGDQRCAILDSDSYARAADLARSEILPELSEALGSRVADLADGDERVRALKTKLDALKRDLIGSSVERERLEERLDGLYDDQRAFQRTLIQFIGADPEAMQDAESTEQKQLELALANRIHDIWQELRPLERQSILEKDLCEALIERLRLANGVNVSRGGRDLIGRLNALQAQLDSVPATAGDDSSSGSRAGRRSACRK